MLIRMSLPEQQQLQAAIAALEGQRALLGDTVIDAALGSLRAKLAAAAVPTDADAGQTLKQVSILFLDVVGSTTLSERLDPEEIHAVMDGALARGTTLVEAHRGRVLQYAGDNLLAVFGADEAREDDAELAVHCALALLELGRTLGKEVRAAYGHAGFNVRVGIHTGSVLLGGGVDGAGTVRGIAVNVAARMEQTAPAGGRTHQPRHLLPGARRLRCCTAAATRSQGHEPARRHLPRATRQAAHVSASEPRHRRPEDADGRTR